MPTVPAITRALDRTPKCSCRTWRIRRMDSLSVGIRVPSIDCNGETLDPGEHWPAKGAPFPDALLSPSEGGRDQIGMVAAIKSVAWPRSNRSRWPRCIGIRTLAGFVGEHSPIHIEWAGQIRSIPFKKIGKAVVPYLEKPEIDALLAAPDRRTAQGDRDHALLLFLYNTGARASEAA